MYFSDNSIKNTILKYLIHLSITFLPIPWIIIWKVCLIWVQEFCIVFIFPLSPSALMLSFSFSYSQRETRMGDLQLSACLQAHKCLDFTFNQDPCLMPYSCSFVLALTDGGTRSLRQSKVVHLLVRKGRGLLWKIEFSFWLLA